MSKPYTDSALNFALALIALPTWPARGTATLMWDTNYSHAYAGHCNHNAYNEVSGTEADRRLDSAIRVCPEITVTVRT